MGSSLSIVRPLALLLVLAFPQLGSAQDDVERARELFQEGLSLVEREQFGEAAGLFEQAYELRASPAIAFNLAAALHRDGQLLAAAAWLDRVLEDGETKPDLRRLARELADEVGAELGQLTVHLEGATEGVAVRIGDRELSESDLGSPVRVEAGAVEVRAVREGTAVATASAEVEKGGQAEVTLTVPAVAAVGAVGVAGSEEEGGAKPLAKKWWFWTAVGGGVAAIVLTAVVASAANKSASPVPGNASPAVLEWR